MCNNCNSQNTLPQTECGCNNNAEFRNIIGYIHTKIMDAVGQHQDFPKIKPEEHYALVVREATKLFTAAGFMGMQFPSFETEVKTLSEIQALKPTDYIAKLVQEGQFSLQGARILQEVLDILDSTMRHASKVNAVKELEGFVSNMRTLAAIEKNALLVGLKIGISSLEFWNRVLKDRNSPYRRAVREFEFVAARLPWADIIGGAVNCVGCSAAGFAGCIGCASVSSGLSSSWFGKKTEQA
jgi:hypothetical protein